MAVLKNHLSSICSNWNTIIHTCISQTITKKMIHRFTWHHRIRPWHNWIQCHIHSKYDSLLNKCIETPEYHARFGNHFTEVDWPTVVLIAEMLFSIVFLVIHGLELTYMMVSLLRIVSLSSRILSEQQDYWSDWYDTNCSSTSLFDLWDIVHSILFDWDWSFACE
jgi:hypothetical protein